MGDFERLTGHAHQADNTGHGPFEVTNVAGNAGSNEFGDFRLQVETAGGGFLAQDGDTGFKAGSLNGSHHTPLETRNQTLLQLGDFRSRAIAREHYLLMVIVELVESVEELVLGRFLASEEMDVVDEQQVQFTVTAAERSHAAGLQGRDEIVGESFGRNISDAGLRIGGINRMRDRMHQVSLAQAGRTMDEKRVVIMTGLFGDRERSSMGHFIFRTDDEVFESIIGLDGRRR